MTSGHRLGLLSLSVLLACGEEPQKIEPIVPDNIKQEYWSSEFLGTSDWIVVNRICTNPKHWG